MDLIQHVSELPSYSPPAHSGTVNRRLVGREFGAGFEMILGQVAPGGEASRHYHVEEAQIVYILKGEADIALRTTLTAFLRGRGLSVQDLGTDSTEPVDYPDIAAAVARLVARGEADAGIVIDGAGIGSAIAANKIAGARAVMATSETIARYSREHNGANVLTLGAALVSADEARTIVATWLTTPMREPRYIRRLAKIKDLER